MSDYGKTRGNGICSSLLLILVGILLNIVPTKIAGAFHLPVFLDSIGTLLSAMLGGIFPAVFVGFFTNLVKSITSDSSSLSMYYGVINIFIGLATVFFYNKKFFDHIHKLFFGRKIQ